MCRLPRLAVAALALALPAAVGCGGGSPTAKDKMSGDKMNDKMDKMGGGKMDKMGGDKMGTGR